MATRKSADTIFVKTFGGLTVYQHNVPKFVKWQSNKARLLFCYLITYYNQWVHRDRLIALLWSDGDPVSNENNFRTTLKRLRIALEGFRINPVMRMGDAYRLNFEAISCDFAMFREEATTGIKLQVQGDIQGALAHLVYAEELCAAEFLPEEPSDPLIQELRQQVGKLQVMVLNSLKSFSPENKYHDLPVVMSLHQGKIPESFAVQPRGRSRAGTIRRAARVGS